MANFEVVQEEESIHVIKETGTEVNYYIFDEYQPCTGNYRDAALARVRVQKGGFAGNLIPWA